MKSKKALATIATLVALTLAIGGVTLTARRAGADRVSVRAADGNKLPDDAIVVEEIIRDGDRATLRIRNRTPFIVMVYIGGVRIGWMRPYRVGMIRGLMNGFHRLYAHSRYGTTSWGPRPVWVPGTWNLLY
jgi:hypothetical protein